MFDIVEELYPRNKYKPFREISSQYYRHIVHVIMKYQDMVSLFIQLIYSFYEQNVLC